MARGEETEVSFRSGGERIYATLRRGRGRAMTRQHPAFLRRVTLSAAASVLQAKVAPLGAMIAPRPLLVVHSKADTVAPFAHGEALAAAAGAAAQLLPIEHSPHCFWISDDSERVQLACVDWLEKRLWFEPA
jgi:pimeloyl-ACP methyl ester carboxylesterase